MKWKRYQDALIKFENDGIRRKLRWIKTYGTDIMHQGQQFLNMASNDYLGLAANREMWDEFLRDTVDLETRFSGGSTSSRLLTGNFTEYRMLESNLAHLYNREAAIVFNSGYHANIGILPALTTKNDLILADKLVHASLIDGFKLSQAQVIRFKHNDLSQVENILAKKRHLYDKVFVVAESIYSMDGDICDLQTLISIKNKYDCHLYIDEAHSFGILGENGLGLCEEAGVIDQIDFIVGTFGKAAAGQGAFLICDQIIRNYLANTVRSLIFTTALPPISIKWLLRTLVIIQENKQKRIYLKEISNTFRKKIDELGYKTAGNSQIVPLIIGDSHKALELSRFLLQEGIFVPAVRPPTVPEGTARLRFSLSAAHTEKDIQLIVNALIAFKNTK